MALKTVGGITFDEDKIEISDKARLKEFFYKEEIQELVNENKWGEIFSRWVIDNDDCLFLIGFLLLADIDFLPYIDHIKNQFENINCIITIDIPDNVTSIGDYAFCKCSSLTSIVIPNSVTSIGESVFYNCPKLKSINFKGKKEECLLKKENIDNKLPITIHCTDGDIVL